MLGESSVYNVLAEGMYFLENVFLYKSSRSNFNFLDFQCLSEDVSIPHVIFETTSQFFINLHHQKLHHFVISQLKHVKFKWNFLEPPIQSVQKTFNILFQRTLFLMFPLSQKYLNPKIRTNKLVNNVVYHLSPSRVASGIHPLGDTS